MTSARIRPGRFPQVGIVAWILAHGGGRQAGSAPLNVFLVLGKHRRLFRGWLHFAGRLMPGGVLPRAESELVILRVAHVRGSDYERHQHERIGRRAGLTDEQLARVAHGPDAAGWTPRQQVLLLAVDHLLLQRDIDDFTWSRIRAHFDERESIELVLLAGHYDMLAAALATFRVQIEGPLRR